MSKHTPGPWTAGRKTVTAPETEDRCALAVRLYGGNPDNLRANARLIAAAPDMLEALQDVVAFWDSITMEDCVNDKHIKARAAIAKALGR